MPGDFAGQFKPKLDAAAAYRPDQTLSDQRTLFDAVRAGKMLASQYRILADRPLGSGGMGEVWLAEDVELGVQVALKLLPPALAHDRSATEHLRREALISRQLTHPNICRLYSFHSDGDLRFIVMEHVDGPTLAQVLRERSGRPMPLEEVLRFAQPIAAALDFAHGVSYTDAAGRAVKGVLHRDIKPANIMLTQAGTPKLMDFGIAREIHNTMTQVTGRSSLTPLYASPEQFRGEPMTAASDIYSFAAVLYECLAGKPYVSPHGDLAWQIMNRPYGAIPGISEAVNSALAAALSREQRDRPQSAGTLIQSLEQRGPVGATTTAPQPRPQDYGAAPTPAARSPKHGVASFVAVAVVLLVLAGGWYFLQGNGGSIPPTPPRPSNQQVADADREKQEFADPAAEAARKTQGDCDKQLEQARRLVSNLDLDHVPSAGVTGEQRSVVNKALDSVKAAMGLGPKDKSAAEILKSQLERWANAPAVLEEIVTLDCNGVPLKLKLIQAGTFTMGSPNSEQNHRSDEGPQHRVTISKAFYVGVTEVTQGQWQAVMGSNPSEFKGDLNLPVEKVSWEDCQEFCRKLSAKTGRTIRLPTEAEWEYACRAGTTTRYSAGDSDEELKRCGWYNANSDNKTNVVAQKEPNAWGLYDMHGNVWEWCQDWYVINYESGAVTDPAGPSSGEFRVLRGGSWLNYPRYCRSAYRYWFTPGYHYYNLGFRVLSGTP